MGQKQEVTGNTETGLENLFMCVWPFTFFINLTLHNLSAIKYQIPEVRAAVPKVREDQSVTQNGTFQAHLKTNH